MSKLEGGCRPFDAVLLISFGGPQGLADIRPFLANVLRGRATLPERIEEVAHHYELFDGVSPLTELHDQTSRRPACATGRRGCAAACVYRHAQLASVSRRHACTRCRARAFGARSASSRRRMAATRVASNTKRTCVRRGALSAHRGVGGRRDHLRSRLACARALHRGQCARTCRKRSRGLPGECRRTRAPDLHRAQHSRTRMAQTSPYREQLRETAAKVAARAGRADWALVYQSRSGRPQDPWLGPDICDYLRTRATTGVEAVVVSPIGFVCDHIEVLYDLDTEAAAVARELGMAFARAESVERRSDLSRHDGRRRAAGCAPIFNRKTAVVGLGPIASAPV